MMYSEATVNTFIAYIPHTKIKVMHHSIMKCISQTYSIRSTNHNNSVLNAYNSIGLRDKVDDSSIFF